MNIKKYLNKNNGKIITQNKDCIEIEFPAGIMKFERYKNENWSVSIPDVNYKKIDIDFIQSVFRRLYGIRRIKDETSKIRRNIRRFTRNKQKY